MILNFNSVYYEQKLKDYADNLINVEKDAKRKNKLRKYYNTKIPKLVNQIKEQYGA